MTSLKKWPWLNAAIQGTTFLGLAILVLVWAGVAYHLKVEHDNAERAAFQNTQNLARAFEAHVIRSLQEVDTTLLMLRTAYEKAPADFDFKHWINNPSLKNDLTWQYHLADADGILKASSVYEIKQRIDVSDLKHFRIHMESADDRLFISEPVIGRSSGQWSVQLTRRISRPDGSFGGVIGAAINPYHFARFYESIGIGKEGSIALIGSDGIVRAFVGLKDNVLGQSFAGGEVMQRFQRVPAGSLLGPGRPDGVRRLLSYRTVHGFPLIVVVGLSEKEVFADFNQKRRMYYAGASAFSLFILLAIGFAARHRFRLGLAHRELASQNLRFEAALNNMSQGLSMYDAEQKLVVCNPQYARLYDLSPEEVTPGTPFRRILERRIARGIYAGSTPTEYLQSQMSAVPKASHRIQELSDGRIISVVRKPMVGGGWVTTHQDITEVQRANARMAYVARHDSLTDLANRAVLIEGIEAALAGGGEKFAVLLLDLDLFKSVNDSLGHAVGDQLLKAVARRLRDCARACHVVARLGGDEFAVLQPLRDHGRATLVELAERMLDSIRQPYDLDGYEVVIETSIGIAVAPDDGAEPTRLLKNADLALYKAKSDGRNGYRFFEPKMDAEAQTRRVIELDLRNAILREEFELHYHRVIDIASEDTASLEALVRWRHPRRGLLTPDQFIPIAEETGLIIPLGDWILRRACADAAACPPQVKVAVNLSPVQFRKGGLVAMVRDAIEQSRLAPDRLELEITESVLLQHNEANLAALAQLRALGVSIVLDDFGTGYSSLSYLRMFRFDKIKIDRSFVRELGNDAHCGAIVGAITGLGRSLDIATTAEGVETDEQLDLLRIAGCAQAQGFLFGRPAPLSELALAPASDEEAA